METIEPPESTSGSDDSESGEPEDGTGIAPVEPGAPVAPEVEIGAPEVEIGESEVESEPEVLAEAEPEPAESPFAAAAPAEPEEAAPPVVAVVVTSGDGPLLEATVASLAAQNYPALSVLVIDNAADADPAARIAAALPSAYVRRLPDNLGFAAAANEALHSVEGATFLLFCHDDVALDPDAVSVMVEEAYRSNAAIVGPKLVDYDNPDVLIEVGMSVDHYAVPFSAIEPGEIDQEQHDGVRDVFFVSHATMLVRADLFREFGGFDIDTAPGSDDIDLCWRARLAGARVLVAPASRVRHKQATALDERLTRRRSPAEARAATRGRVRVLFKSYSTVALVWVLPSGFVLTLVEALGLTLTRRWRHAIAVIAGWFPARGGLRDLRQARAATQAMRQVDDADVRDLMVRGSARFRSLLVQRLHAGDRLADASTRARARVATTRNQMGRAPAILALVVGLLIVIGSRALIFGRVPDIGTFQSWPGVGSLWSTFTSPWRYTMVGNRAAATPAFALMSVLSTVLLGHGALARTVVVTGALPLGVWGSYRLVRTMTGSLMPAVVAATAYAANPVARDAVARGELGPLLCFALAPFVFHALVRVTGRDADDPTPAWRSALRTVVVVGLLSAVVACVWPPAILLGVLFALVFVIAIPFAWADMAILRTAGLALLGVGVSLLLLAPWVVSLLGADASTLGLRVRAPLSFADTIRFDVGPAPAGWFTLGLLVTALVPLVIASGPLLVWATRAWVLVLASFALAWVPTRISATAPVPAPQGVLVPAALGIAIAAGLGVSALLSDMRRSRFGWRQVSAVACVVGLALPLIAFAADTASGRWQLPSDDWPTSVTWMSDLPSPGGFRVLWLGNPAVLPVDAKVVDGIGYGLTRDGGGDARTLWAAPENQASDTLAAAIVAARNGDTARLGHLVAPIGVRYIAIVDRLAPSHGTIVPAGPRLADALGRQLDLTVSRIDQGAVIYANDAWIPRRAVVPSATPVTVPESSGSGVALAAAAQSDAASVAKGVDGPLHGSDPAGPGTLLWAEAAAGGWRATASGHELAHSQAFNWTNAYVLPAHASISMRYHSGLLPGLRVIVEVFAWLFAIAIWWRLRAASRPAPAGDDMTAPDTPVRGRRRAPILILVIVALVAGAWAGHAHTPAAARTASVTDAAQAPRSHAISTAWYCPGLPSSFPNADQTVTLSNLGSADTSAAITVNPDGGAAPITQTVSVPHDTVLTLDRSTLLTVGAPTPAAAKPLPQGPIVVEPFSPEVVVAAGLESDSALSVVPCATTASADWQFAAGTTVRGVSQWLVLDDPFSSDARVDLTLRTDSGLLLLPSLTGIDVPGRSRVVIPIHDQAVRQDRVAVEVHADVGQVVAAQTIQFANDAGAPGVATSFGALAPSSRWWFTDGLAVAGAQQWVAVTDPGPVDAHVVVQATIGSKGIVSPVLLTVPSGSVSWVQVGGCHKATKNCLAVPDGSGFELAVQSDPHVPVVAQTLSRFDKAKTAVGATTSIGSTAPARDWVIARTRALDEQSTSISLMNPGVPPAHVDVQVVDNGTDEQPGSVQHLTIASGARIVLPSGSSGVTRAGDAAVMITSDVPIFAESTIYAKHDATRAPGIPTR